MTFLNFWPLHQPRREITTAWGTVHYWRKGIATGIEISDLSVTLPQGLLGSLPSRDADPGDLPVIVTRGPSTYYDRKASTIFIHTEIGGDPAPTRHDESWGAIFRAQSDCRIVAIELASVMDLLPGDLLGWFPTPGQTRS